MDSFMGMRVIQSPLVPSELPRITFDPQRKCTWASEAYRAEIDAWLLKMFGTQTVAFVFDPKYIGFGGGPQLAINPLHVAMLKNFAYRGSPQRNASGG